MQRPLASDLLRAWEAGLGQKLLPRGVRVIAALEGKPTDAYQEMSMGEWHRRIWMWRRAVFGETLQCAVHCPSCKEPLEFDFAPQGVEDDLDARRGELPGVAVQGVWFRPPSLRDVEVIAGSTERVDPESALLTRCAVAEVAEWSQELKEEAVRALEDLDPLGACELELQCGVCAMRWTEGLDIVSYFWQELDSMARRLLDEVHTLALHYHWSESDILALSEERRASYLSRLE